MFAKESINKQVDINLSIMNKKKIVIFSGAGIDKESGIPTFRDSDDSLWVKYDVDKVASIEGWKQDREAVLDFHNEVRREMKKCKANKAHKIIGKLEDKFDVTIVTQNISNLHEEGGSTNVLHIHGSIDKTKSSLTGEYHADLRDDEDVKIGDKCEQGSQLRHGTVLFGDPLPEQEVKSSLKAIKEADILVIIGTSLQVYPAAGMIAEFQGEHIYVVDPGEVYLAPADGRTFIVEPATKGMKYLYDRLLKEEKLEPTNN